MQSALRVHRLWTGGDVAEELFRLCAQQELRRFEMENRKEASRLDVRL